MADYYVCSDCGNECDLVDVGNELRSEERSDCCGAEVRYMPQEKEIEWDRDDWNWMDPLDPDIDY